MSSVNRPITKAGGVPVSPLLIYQPFNMCMIYLSFISQNFKGFIYLGFLIGVCVVRNFVYMLNGAKTETNDGTICTSIQYSAYGNPTFSAFVFAFTIMYLSLPMFSNGAPNFWVFLGLIVYFFIDIFIKIYKKCAIQTTDLVLNILLGLVSSAIIVSLMYAGGSGKYLFFNEVSSTKEICSQPKKQTFKCQVFKDGTLVGNI
jgi:hypothetical protein